MDDTTSETGDCPEDEGMGAVKDSDKITSMEDARERFDRNLQAIKQTWPVLIEKIENYTPTSELIFLDNGEPDLLFKGVHLYNGEGAYTYTRKQIDSYWKSPSLLVTSTPEPNSLDKHAARMLMKTLDKIKSDVAFGGSAELRESKECYFAFLLGLGLGTHVHELIETTNARVVMIVESNFDFFYQSLFICDWAGLFEEGNNRAFKIEYLGSGSTREIAHSLGGLFRKYNPTTVDGTVIFQHYNSSTYVNAYRYFMEKVFKLALMGLGFFEDEINMIAQTYENLSSGNRRIMRKAKDLSFMPMPAAIIGNGPSLDSQFEYLRKIQDRVIIISCGTAIDALLRQGINPDFQIQIERDVEELRLYRYTAKNHDLSKVCLVGSSTIFPGIADLFGETIYFFRPGLSSMPIFMVAEDERLPNPDPSVTNAGLAFALHAGFREMYFFGTDVGAKDIQHHHSKSSLYHVEDLELPWYLDPKHNISITESFNSEVPGNFGGTVYSSGLLLWTKNNLETVMKQNGAGRHFYNCSDGAYIDGTIPLLPTRLKIPDPQKPKSEILLNFIDYFPVYDRPTFDRVWTKADVFNRIKKMADDLIGAIDENPELENKDYSRMMMQYLMPGDSADGISMLYRGTLFLYMISMNYFLNRAQTDEMKVIVRDVYAQDLKDLIVSLRDEALAYFEDAVAKKIDYDIPLDRDGKNMAKGDASA